MSSSETIQARKVLSVLLSRSLFSADISLPTGEIDWTLVYDEALAQTVTAVAFDGIRKADSVPQEIFSRWRSATLQTAMRQNIFYSSVARLHEIMATAKINYAVIKGIANARFYPKPELRIQGDTDFLVDPSDFSKADKLLRLAGFKPLSSGNDIHLRYSYGGAIFEMHRAIGGIPDTEQGKKAQQLLLDGLKSSQTVQMGACSFNTLQTDLEAAITLIHMHEHLLETSTTLRHLCDFALLSQSVTEEFSLLSERLCISKAYYLYKYVSAGVFSDFPLPTEKVNDFDESDIQTVLNYFWDGGHFGRNYESYQGGSLVTEAVGSKTGFAGSVKNYVFKSYPVCEKHKLLLPLFFVVCCLKYLWLIAAGRRKAFNPAKVASEFERKKSVFEKIDLFESNNSSVL